jgi:hypothetical protein
MNGCQVTFKNGHFYKSETNERLDFVQHQEYFIVSPKDAMFISPSHINSNNILNGEGKSEFIKHKYERFGKQTKKILDAGAQLYFRVGNNQKIHGDKDIVHVFTCVLLEDLYLYCTTSKYAINYPYEIQETQFRACDCMVQLEQCIFGNTTINDQISATSLNQLFNITVQTFFSNQHSGSCNIFETFGVYDARLESEEYLNNSLPKLKVLRKDVCDAFKISKKGQ